MIVIHSYHLARCILATGLRFLQGTLVLSVGESLEFADVGLSCPKQISLFTRFSKFGLFS